MGTDAAFATLGIAVGSQPIAITRAFRALSRELHPDRGGDPRRFSAIVTAYRALQKAGLVRAEPVRIEPAAPFPERTENDRTPSRHPSPVESYYRRFLQGLDRAALEPDPPARSVQQKTTRAPIVAAYADRFAEILERELLRIS